MLAVITSLLWALILIFPCIENLSFLELSLKQNASECDSYFVFVLRLLSPPGAAISQTWYPCLTKVYSIIFRDWIFVELTVVSNPYLPKIATDTTVTKPPIAEAFADKWPSLKFRQHVWILYLNDIFTHRVHVCWCWLVRLEVLNGPAAGSRSWGKISGDKHRSHEHAGNSQQTAITHIPSKYSNQYLEIQFL